MDHVASSQSLDQVAQLIKASESVSESRLAMVLSILVIICVIIALLELGRFAKWYYESYKNKKEEDQPATTQLPGYPSNGNGNGATQGKIEQRVQDIHDSTTLCGATQRDTLNLVKEFRQDVSKAFERTSENIKANTEAMQTNTEVLRSLVEHFEMRPCQMDPAEIAKKIGLPVKSK
jgi:hypothetical protein